MMIQASNRLQKLAPYAFKEIEDRVTALKEQGIKPIDFGVGDPSEPTPDFVIEALTPSGRKHASTGYPSYSGSAEFRQAASDYMQANFNVTLNPDTEISSNMGSKEAIFNFPEGFINPGDVVIVPSPGYPPMKTGTLFAEGEPYLVPLLEENGFFIDYESIPAEIAQRAKIIWINYPNSPTGTVAPREFYEGLIKWAHRHNIIVAADEGCYIDIYFDKKPISILEIAREGVVAFYSLSKRNNMTGYRVGFVAGDKTIIDIYQHLKTNVDSGVPNVIQDVAIKALKNTQHVASMRQLYREKREILYDALTAAGLTVRLPDATFYIWQKVPSGMTDVEFATRLLDPKIAIVVTPGSLISDVCHDGTNPGAGYVRFALMPIIEEIREAKERLRGVVFDS